MLSQSVISLLDCLPELRLQLYGTPPAQVNRFVVGILFPSPHRLGHPKMAVKGIIPYR